MKAQIDVARTVDWCNGNTDCIEELHNTILFIGVTMNTHDKQIIGHYPIWSSTTNEVK